MYINIGTFQKGETNSYFTPELYQRWMKVFAFLQNPVVAFFDNEEDMKYFENLRHRLGANHTKVILVKRSQLWSFSLRHGIRNIFNQPGYPKHHPNTVIPEYSCVMHAKYEFMRIATEVNIFHTQYFAWLDIGLFRILAESNDLSFFEIWLPPNFNSSTVAYTEVYRRMTSLNSKEVIYRNAVWVSGAFFIGEKSVMTKWTSEYIAATKALLKKFKLMSTDQQVLYILYNWGQHTVNIQTYKNKNKEDWFYLGYLCKDQGYIKNHGPIQNS